MLMAALAEHLEKTGYVGAVVLAALNPELGGSIETVRCVNFCLTTNTILTTIQSLFIGHDANRNDFGDMFGLLLFKERVIQEVGKFAGKVYRKYSLYLEIKWKLTVNMI